MKNEMYYKGKVLVKGNKLGHHFIELKDGEEKSQICFTDRKNYAMGGLYEVEHFNDNKLKIGKYLDKDITDIKVFEEWKKEDAECKARYEMERNEKIFVNKRNKGMYDNLTISELKEKCNNNYVFRKMMVYAILGGDL